MLTRGFEVADGAYDKAARARVNGIMGVKNGRYWVSTVNSRFIFEVDNT